MGILTAPAAKPKGSRQARESAPRPESLTAHSLERRPPSSNTSDDTSSFATAHVYNAPSASSGDHERVVEAIDIYDYADSLQASATPSATASAAEVSSLASKLQNQASLTHSTSWFDDDPKPPSPDHANLKTRPPSPSGPDHATRDILRLMRETKGLMHGSFMFRLGPSQPWTRSNGYIMPQGSLVHSSDNKATAEALVPDLHACRVVVVTDLSTHDTFLRLRITSNTREIHFRPRDPAYLNAWFAAILCWRSAASRGRPKSSAGSRRPIPLSASDEHAEEQTPKSEWRQSLTLRQEDAIMLEPRGLGDVKRIKVSCVLQGSGQLNLHVGAETNRVATIPVNEIFRSAIQRVDYSVFHSNLVLVIRPRYSKTRQSKSRLSPLYISFSSRQSLETWFVLLQTMASPELYGAQRLQSVDEFDLDIDLPKSQTVTSSMVRILHGLKVRINKVKLYNTIKRSSRGLESWTRQDHSTQAAAPSLFYVEILLDDQLYAVTASQAIFSNRVHFFETLALHDVPSQMHYVGIRVKRHEPPHTVHGENTQSTAHPSNSSAPTETYAEAAPLGDAIFELQDLSTWSGTDQMVSLLDSTGEAVGEISLNVDHHREVVLMESEYEKAVESFNELASPISLAMSEHAQPPELPKVAERLLNIFSTCGNVQEWLMSLAESEISAPREPPDSARRSDGETMTEDSANLSSPPSEVVLLFRGNTLFSKALDLYMKRVGQAYLEGVLRNKISEIAIYEPDCEVDPSKITNNNSMDKNWRRLMNVVESIWRSIYESAEACPMELRVLFRHISKLAYRRYNKTAPTARYTSISGFLFLRFFCAAILHPHLFGLLDDDPSTAPTAQRTFMLIAKAIQGLANMTTFGNKEPWLAPMNTFVSDHCGEFTRFIDQICNVDGDWMPPIGLETKLIANSATRSQYMRLSQSARNGIPSLPYLIDRPRDIAALVRLLAERSHGGEKRLSTVSTTTAASSGSVASACSDVPSFQAMCNTLHAKTMRLVAEAVTENMDEFDAMTPGWESTAERMETRPSEFWITGMPDTLYADVPDIKEQGNGSKLPFFKKIDKEKEKLSTTRPMRKAPSQLSTGSSKSAEKKKQKNKSPARSAPDNAMRKLGWM